MKLRYFLIFIGITGCSNPIETALNSNHIAIQKVMNNLPEHEVQILFTQIDSTDNGQLKFTQSSFQVDRKQYFYPASTVKLPMAIFATEMLSKNDTLTLDTPYITSRDSLLHNPSDDLRQLFAVSDNEAYNRLYEMLGRDYINVRFRESRLLKSRISHRLSTSKADVAKTLKVKFFPSYESDIYELNMSKDHVIEPLKIKGIFKGKGFIQNNTLVEEPMDFSKKNYFPLEAQHEVMKRLLFPQSVTPKKRFKLKENERFRILKAMKTLPRNTGYNENQYYDSYVKFFLYGDSKERIPEHIEIYNKVGVAYGTLTETAYIIDKNAGVHFLLSATIHVNKNGIFNDDSYEYDQVGIPFLAQLGRELYQMEVERK